MTHSPIPSKTPRRVAVIRLSSAGDVVLTSAALESLKKAWPDTELYYVTKALYQPLIEHSPHVTKVIPWTQQDTPSTMKAKLSALRIEAVVDLHNNQRTKILGLLSRGIRRVAWKKRPWAVSAAVRLGLRPYHPKQTITESYHQAIEELVGEAAPRGHLRYYTGPHELQESQKVLVQAGFKPGQPLVGVSPGAKWNTKRWPAKRFGELVARTQERGFQCIITGSDDEIALAHEIVQAAPHAINLVGKVPFSLLGGVIAHCDTFLANDSGPMHISRGLGVPTLAFFGSTAPAQFSFEGLSFLFTNEPCAPCHFYGRNSCPKKHLNCLTHITTDDAWSSLEPLLDGKRRPFLKA